MVTYRSNVGHIERSEPGLIERRFYEQADAAFSHAVSAEYYARDDCPDVELFRTFGREIRIRGRTDRCRSRNIAN
jgi:hypothetical protein